MMNEDGPGDEDKGCKQAKGQKDDEEQRIGEGEDLAKTIKDPMIKISLS
jgi:hypothetical protein